MKEAPYRELIYVVTLQCTNLVIFDQIMKGAITEPSVVSVAQKYTINGLVISSLVIVKGLASAALKHGLFDIPQSIENFAAFMILRKCGNHLSVEWVGNLFKALLCF